MAILIRSYNLLFSIYVVLYLNKADNDQFEMIMLPIISNLCILYEITSREPWLYPGAQCSLRGSWSEEGCQSGAGPMLLSLVFLI